LSALAIARNPYDRQAVRPPVRAAKPDERRRYRRVDTIYNGRIMDGAGAERSCNIIDMSAGGARVAADGRFALNDNVIIYAHGMGRLEGTVIRRDIEGCAVRLNASAYKRDRIVDRLTWAMNKDRLGLGDERRESRYATDGEVVVTRDDGRVLMCEMIDFSMVGMGLACPAADRPLVGSWVQVGSNWGKVARWLDRGFGVDFETKPG
jgi:hypothetical protein